MVVTKGTAYSQTAGTGGNSYFQVSWSQTSQSTTNNSTTISYSIKLVAGNYWYTNAITLNDVKINGSTVRGNKNSQGNYPVTYPKTWSLGGATGTYDVASGTTTISHNSDGTKTFSILIDCWFYEDGDKDKTTSFTLTSIPRGTTCTHSVNSKTETTVTINWSAGDTCDKVWTKVGNGSWDVVYNNSTGASSGTYTISGLSPNTTYSIITDVRRKSSQVETQATALSVTTYAYPHCTSAPDFTIGNSATIALYNPLSRSCTINLKASNGDIAQTLTTNTTSCTIAGTTASQNVLYASIPNASSGTYTVSVAYSSSTTTKTGTYKVGSAAKPNIGGGSYQDTNSTIVAITNDSSKIIPNKSTLTITGTGISTNKSAGSIESVKVKIGSTNYTMTLSNNTATKTGLVITSSTQNQAVITVTDSRGLTNTKTIDLDVVAYNPPQVQATAKRASGFYSDTTITPKVTFTTIGNNSITINMQAVATGETTITRSNMVNNTGVVISLNNQKAWTLSFTVTDSFGSESTYTLKLNQGIPLIFFDTKRLSVGINKFPESNNTLEINGNIIATKTDANNADARVIAQQIDSNNTVECSVSLNAANSNNHGIWSDSNEKWLVYQDTSGNTHLGPNAYHNTTTENGRTNLSKIYIGKTLLRDILYPIGSIYMSTEATSPADIWGGSWTQIGVGKTLVSAGTSSQTSVYTVGATGGATTTSYTPAGTNAGTAITADQMPKHNGHIDTYSGSLKYYMPLSVMTQYGSGGRGWQEYSGGEVLPASNNRGGGKTHTHTFTGTAANISTMQPWYAVYMWRRTA